jgi:hypothetical protein
MEGQVADEWLGKEMLRQVELRLAAQATALAALEARAAGLLNLCGAGSLAAAAAIFTAQPHLAKGALAAGLMLLGAAIVLLVALRARPGWGVVGIRVTDMGDYGDSTQEDCLRVMAQALDKSVPGNSARLNSLGAALRLAERLILAAPVVGGLVVLAAR